MVGEIQRKELPIRAASSCRVPNAVTRVFITFLLLEVGLIQKDSRQTFLPASMLVARCRFPALKM
jgi:hypothetical protein